MLRIRGISGALALIACAAIVAGCGEDDSGTIPAEQGQALLAQLDEIDASVQAGECDRAQDVAVSFATRVSELPAEVDDQLRDRLVEAGANLETLTETQCEPATGASGETGTVPEETQAPPATTETVPEETPEEPAEERPPDESSGEGGGGGNGGGNGNGNGNGPPEDGDDASGGIGSDG